MGMQSSRTWIGFAGLVLGTGVAVVGLARFAHRLGPNRAVLAHEKNDVRLGEALAARGLALGAPVFLRIFKEPGVLELWVGSGERFELYRTYPILRFSGELGPKTAEGDHQSPEGCYRITAERLHPWSRYHLAFHLDYPNAIERARGWTGSALMIHGGKSSVGCYAMGDGGIEELYVVVEAALAAGQEGVSVHAFPFPLTDEELGRRGDHPWREFWGNLQPVYEEFERERVPPGVGVEGTRYRVE